LTALHASGILSLTFAGKAGKTLHSIHCVVKGDILLALALCQLLVLSDCVTTTTQPGVAAGNFEQQLDDACGKPIAYPLSAKCITLMGGVGPTLQHRSDLVMRIWRTCPDENPCNQIAKTDPACTGQSANAPLTAVSDPAARADDQCQRAQQANYSCAALRNDLVYKESLRQPAAPADPDDSCAENKNRLDEFDSKIKEMSVRIQWYRVFAGQSF
jgi:hypothetical protein